MARRYVRKNLMVDPESLRALAQKWGTSDSETVRNAIDRVLSAEEAMEALEELRKLGGVADVFNRLSEELSEIN